jgi:hypothetical protein
MPSDLLTDGFLILARMPIREIEARIAWLEATLASYRTLHMLRVAMESKPEGLETPPTWEQIVPETVQQPPVADDRDSLQRMREWMAKQTETVTPKQIEIGSGVSARHVNNLLKQHKDVFFERAMHGQWRLRANGKSVAEVSGPRND